MPEISLILHNIRSTYNVGAIFRTAEGFGVKKIICSGYTPYPRLENDSRLPHLVDKLTAQIHKTALGAETLVPCEYYETFQAWRSTNANLPLLALEQAEESVPLRDFRPPKSFALLIGEEVAGIDPDLLSEASTIVEIPMSGKKESFNVAVATGIALYGLLG